MPVQRRWPYEIFVAKLTVQFKEFVRENNLFLCNHSLTTNKPITLSVGIQTYNVASGIIS
jgi:hypothetical protein